MKPLTPMLWPAQDTKSVIAELFERAPPDGEPGRFVRFANTLALIESILPPEVPVPGPDAIPALVAPLTREQWLNAATDQLRPLFEAAGFKVPDNVRNTCGFPSKSALANKKQRIGECWSDSSSDGKVFEIFISPVLADPIIVLATLAHELVHATVGLEAKHNGPFRKCAKGIGLEGKMTATHAGEALTVQLQKISKAVGPYPHKQLRGMINGEKKQGTRLIKCECPECGYTVRTTRSWLEFGAPVCPVDEVPMQFEEA